MLSQNRLLRTSLPLVLLTFLALPGGAQGSHQLESDAYGEPSGPGVVQNLGLILEYVPSDGGRGSLRLYGGVPGQPAGLMVGSSTDFAPGTDGSVRLVGRAAWTTRGTFDEQSTFSVELADIPAEVFEHGAYAQGIAVGQLAWGPIPFEGTEMSQGLYLEPVAEGREAFTLSDLGPRLPERRRDEIEGAFAGGDLALFLDTSLDSVGDQISVKVDGDLAVTVYPGISIGGKLALEALVAREGRHAYSVSIKRDAAIMANVGLGDFAGIEGARGLAERTIFTFPSPQGAARGIWGLWMAMNMPPVTTLPALPDRRGADVAEAAWARARTLVSTAAASVSSARSRVSRTGGRGPAAFVARTVAMQVLAGAQRVLQVAQSSERQAYGALQVARAAVEQALSGFWKAQRLIHEIDGVRRYAALHEAGYEATFFTTGEVKVSLLGSVCTIQGTDLGFKAGLERAVMLRAMAAADAQSPATLEVKMWRKKSTEAWGGLMAGGRAACENVLAGRVAFEVGPNASQEVTKELILEANAWARYELTVGYAVGVAINGVVEAGGVGRKSGFTLPLEEVHTVVTSFDGQGASLRALADMRGDFSMADYRVEGYVSRYGLNVAGTGGTIGFEALVTDVGGPLELEQIFARRAHHTLVNAVIDIL